MLLVITFRRMRAAVVQMTSTADLDRNLERSAHWIERARSEGAELVALPENFAFMRDEDAGPSEIAQGLEGPVVQFLRDQARRHSLILAGGTFPERIAGDPRPHNTSVLIDSDGELRAVYRKIHLFEIDLPEVSFRESKGISPGRDVVVAELPSGGIGPIGMSVCYDLRFPELYRQHAERGATVLLVPSAFTVPTGRAHWELLLRARAVENQAFVVAAAQFGAHSPRRSSYGHSMIVDPWGRVLCEVPDREGIGLADLDRGELDRIRARLPALDHRVL